MTKQKDNRTYKDRTEYFKMAVVRRRKRLRDLAIGYKGSKCQKCGYKKCSEALEFHHTDKNKKDFGLSARGVTRSWKKVKSEIDKCVLVCANCHREIHSEINNKKSKLKLQS